MFGASDGSVRVCAVVKDTHPDSAVEGGQDDAVQKQDGIQHVADLRLRDSSWTERRQEQHQKHGDKKNNELKPNTRLSVNTSDDDHIRDEEALLGSRGQSIRWRNRQQMFHNSGRRVAQSRRDQSRRFRMTWFYLTLPGKIQTASVLAPTDRFFYLNKEELK